MLCSCFRYHCGICPLCWNEAAVPSSCGHSQHDKELRLGLTGSYVGQWDLGIFYITGDVYKARNEP